jgi:glucokinase
MITAMPRGHLRGGIDLGGTKIQAVVVDAENKPLGQARHPTPSTGGPRAVMKEMIVAMQEAAHDAGVEPGSLAGVGVGSPGDVEPGEGTVAEAGNLNDWTDPVPVAATLGQALGAPVKLGNDVEEAVMAEFELGAGKPYRSLLGVFWGTGVGGGLILNGHQWDGRGSAGEIGHMVVREGGRRCTCGRKGCMEAYAGRLAMEIHARKLVKRGKKTKLFQIAKERKRDRLTSGVWQRALDDGDKMAKDLIHDAIVALGAGVASAVNLLDVEAIVIGGGLGVRFGEPYVHKIEKAMKPHLFIDDRPPKVHLAALGDLGGAIGAALLVTNAS